MKEAAFDMALARKTMELVKKHGLKYTPTVLVPSDDAMADRLYQAGLELFLEMGVYNQSTERRILFSRQEVEAAVAEEQLLRRDAVAGEAGDILRRDAAVRPRPGIS